MNTANDFRICFCKIFKIKWRIDKLSFNSKQIFTSNQYQVYCIKLDKFMGKWNKYCQ